MVCHTMMYGYIHHHNVILYTVHSCCTSNHDAKIHACLSNGNPQVAYLAKKHGICISHEATCPIPQQQNWQTQNYFGHLKPPSSWSLMLWRYRQKPSRKAQQKWGWIFWGETPSRTACKQCLHSTACDETYLGCFMAVPQNEPQKTWNDEMYRNVCF